MLAPLFALACAAQSVTPVQDPSERDWRRVDDEITALTSSLAAQGGRLEWGGYIKVSYGHADEVATGGTLEDISRFGINNARLHVASELAGWHVYVGLRGEQDSGNGFFGDIGTVGLERAFEVIVQRDVFDRWGPMRDGRVQLGKFRPAFLGSSLIEDNQLLFINRTYNGERWDFYDQGAQVDARLGPLRGFLSVQNGLLDRAGEEVAVSLRGMWDVVGPGVNYVHEGALDAPDGFALSLGGAAYFDTTDDDASAQALEAHLTLERFYASGELVDNGDGLTDLYSWEVTASFLVTDDIEIAARYGDFDRADDTRLWRAGINKYLRGHDVKLQFNYSTSDSNAPRADVDVYQLGFVFSL